MRVVAPRGTLRLSTDTPGGMPVCRTCRASSLVKCLAAVQSRVPNVRHSVTWAVIAAAMAGMPWALASNAAPTVPLTPIEPPMFSP